MTGRLPFDPSRMKTGKRAGAEGGNPSASGNSTPPNTLSVSQLAARIDNALKTQIRGRIVVAGEISSLTHRTHWYFSLKDAHAVVGAVVFSSVARKIAYTPKHGDSVIATGRLEFYAPSGRVSFIIETMSPAGEGDLQAKYRALCDQLRTLGWFDPLTKNMLPAFPRRVAAVTSQTGAALQDVINTMGKRCPAVDLIVVDVRVQGDSAASQIAHAVQMLNAQRDALGIDAILITRGGGSLEDLWAFNERQVAQAIHDSVLPVVAAIGHETDTTIAELVADERCATPTQAAMKLTPDREALAEQLASIHQRLRTGVRHAIGYRRQSLQGIAGSRALASPQRIVEIQRDRVAALEHRLKHVAQARISTARRRLDTVRVELSRHQPAALHARRVEYLAGLDRLLTRAIQTRIRCTRDQLIAVDRELHAIGPMRVLARGFSVTQTADGQLVRNPSQVGAGEMLTTHVAEGVVRSKVVGKGKKPPKPPEKPQMDLF